MSIQLESPQFNQSPKLQKQLLSSASSNAFANQSCSDAPLGNNANNGASQEYQRFQRINNLQNLRDDIDLDDIADESQIRYKMLHSVRKSLLRFSDLTTKRKNKESGKTEVVKVKHRISECHYGFVPSQTPSIKNSHGSSRWHNVKKCNDEFCPVCSVKVGMDMRNEIAGIIAQAYTEGYQVVMMTPTGQHDASHTSSDNVEAMHNAWQFMTKSHRWRNLCEKFGIKGYIRRSEATFNPINGSHHHFHVALLVDDDVFDERDWQRDDGNEDDLWRAVTDIWIHSLNRYGRTAQPDVELPNGKLKNLAIDFQIGDQYVAEYIAKMGRAPKDCKWDITAEMSMQSVKRSDDDHYSMFELLILCFAGDAWAQSMYAEYVDAMYNKHKIELSQLAKDLKKRMPDVEPPQPEQPSGEPDPVPEYRPSKDAFRVARNSVSKRGHWLELHQRGDKQALMFEVAHAHVLGKFLYSASIGAKRLKDGWFNVTEVSLQGQHDFIDSVVTGRVHVVSGRVTEVVATLPLDDWHYGKWIIEKTDVSEDDPLAAEEPMAKQLEMFNELKGFSYVKE